MSHKHHQTPPEPVGPFLFEVGGGWVDLGEVLAGWRQTLLAAAINK